MFVSCPAKNQAPCNYQGAIWKAKLLSAPMPKKIHSWLPCMEGWSLSACCKRPFTIWPCFPHGFVFPLFSKLPNAQLWQGESRSYHWAALCSWAIYISEPFKLAMMACSYRAGGRNTWGENPLLAKSNPAFYHYTPSITIFFPWSKCMILFFKIQYNEVFLFCDSFLPY